MSHTKPKWLIAAIMAVAILGLSVTGLAAPPPDPIIVSPTSTGPVAVQPGNNVYVTFDYISQPTVLGTTRAEIVIRLGGTIIGTRQVAFPLLPDTGAAGNTFTAAVPIVPGAAQNIYNVRLEISNHDGTSNNVTGSAAVIVDSTPPDNVPNFADIISSGTGAVLTWTEPTDGGTPPSGIGWYEVSINDGVNPPSVFHDIPAVDADPVTPGFQWPIPGVLADGNYTVSVWALDKAYNRSAGAGTGTLIVDTTKPVLDQQGPVGFVSSASPTLTARFRDIGLGVSGYELFVAPPDVFTLDGVDVTPATEPASGAASGFITASSGILAEGLHEVELAVRDRAGNVASLGWEFRVDTVLPTEPASVTAPDPITTGTPAFYWTPGVDNGTEQSGVYGYRVQILSGLVPVGAPYTVTVDENLGTPDFDWTLPDALTLDGDYEIRVWTLDNAGNVSAAYASDGFRRDTQSPVLDMEAPADMTWTEFVPPTIKVRFRDLGAGATGFGSVVAFTVDTDPYTAVGLTAGDLGPGSIVADLSAAALADGLHTVSITVSDVAGNVITKTWQFSKDTTPPVAPTSIAVVGGTLAFTPPPVWWTLDPTPQFTWTPGTDIGGSGVVSYKVEIYLGSTLESTYSGVVDEDGVLADVQWTIPNTLADGIYEIRVYAVDACGNESVHAGVTFGVDSSISTVMLDQAAPAPASWVNVNTPELSVRFRDLAVPSSGFHSVTAFTVDATDMIPYITSTPAPGAQVGHIKATAPTLAEGAHTAAISVRDYAGNVANLGWTFSVDTVLPGSPGAITVTTPTIDTTPNFAWVAATDTAPSSGIAGYIAEIHNGSGLVLGPYEGIPGLSWDLPDHLPADGPYTIKLWAVDGAGNVSAASTDAAFVLDTTAPVLQNPTPTGFINATTPTVSATFTDVGGSGFASLTTFTIDGGDVSFGATVPGAGALSGTISQTSPVLAEGSHNVVIAVQDAAGNAASLAWSFTVDTTPPVAPTTVTAPDPTNDTTPTFTWDAGTDVGGSGVASYTVEVWSAGWGGIIGAPYTGITGLTFTVPQPNALSPDGDYGVRVYAVDVAGNVSLGYGSDTFVLDTGKPVLSNGTPTGLQPATGLLTMQFADDRTGLDGSATDIELVDGLGNPGTVGLYTQPGDGTLTGQISATYSAPTDGTWTVTATIKDLAGNESDPLTWSFQVDTTPPTVTGIYPVDESTTWDKWTEIHAIILDGEAPDGTPGSGVDQSSISGRIFPEGAMPLPLFLSSYDTGTGLAVLQVPIGWDLVDGHYEVIIEAQDMAGNTGDDDWAFALQQTYAPAMEALPQFVNTNSVTVTWTDVDNEAEYELQRDMSPSFGNPVAQVLVVDTTSYDETSLADGTYYWRIRAIAYGDRVSLWSNTVSTTVDTIAPDAPVVTLLTPSPTNEVPQSWNWTAPIGADGYMVSLDAGSTWEDVGNVRTYQTWFNTDGAYTLTVKAYDLAGNESGTDADTVTIDVTGPAVPTGLSVTTPTTDTTPTWTWDAMAGAAGYEVRLDGAIIRDVANAIAYTHAEQLSNGSHTLEVQAYDALGNKSGWCSPVTVTVDTLPPAAPAIAPLAAGYNASPIAIDWNDVVDGSNAITYVLQYADNAGFDNPTQVTGLTASQYSFDAATEGEGSYWFRVKTISTVNVGEIKESLWSPIVSTIYDVTGPLAPVLTLETPNPTKDSPQRWSWSAPEGAVGYLVSVDGGTPINVGDVTTYHTTFNTTANHTLSVQAYDWLGNAGGVAIGSVDVDVAAPAVPTGLSVTTPTTDTTPTWTWDAMAGAAGYEVRLDGAIIRNVANAIAYTHAEQLSNGSHTLEVQAYDALGNKSGWCSPVTVTVDTLPPAAPVIAPLAAGYNASPIAINWNDVVDGSNAITYVLQYADNAGFDNPTQVTGLTASQYSFDAATEGEGQYWFRVKTISTVNVGEIKESLWSPIVSTIYDVTPPGQPTLILLTPNPTNESPQTWSWSAPAGATRYEVQADGGLWINVGDTRTYQTTFTTTGLHTFKVRAYDWLDNMGLEAERTVYVDRDAPAVPTGLALTEPAGTDIGGVIYTADGTPKVMWNAVADADLHHYVVERDGVVWLEVLAPTASYEFYEGLADGAHTVRVRSVDALGNQSAYSAPLTFTVDTTPPAVPGMPRTATPTKNPNPVWTWGAVAGAAKYRVFEDDVDKGFVTAASYTSTNLTEGTHYVQVTAIDALNNESARSAPGYVAVDLTAPAVPVLQPLAAYTNADRVTLIWTAVDTAVKYDVEYTINGAATAVPDIAVATFTVNIANPIAVDGNIITAKVRAYDAVGNVTVWSNVVSTEVDRTGPVVTILTPTAAVSTNSSTFVYEWTAIDPGCGVKSYTIELNGGKHQVDETSVDGHYRYEAALKEGSNTFKVFATDKLGNVGEIATAPTVTRVIPQIIIIGPMPGATYKINEISTVVFQVIGLIDTQAPEVRLNGAALEPWRIVGVSSTPAMAKFYVLLDEDVMAPGWMSIAISVGGESHLFSYIVDSERSGFGFGRLRPW